MIDLNLMSCVPVSFKTNEEIWSVNMRLMHKWRCYCFITKEVYTLYSNFSLSWVALVAPFFFISSILSFLGLRNSAPHPSFLHLLHAFGFSVPQEAHVCKYQKHVWIIYYYYNYIRHNSRITLRHTSKGMLCILNKSISIIIKEILKPYIITVVS